jgi:polyisoprenoid-binding protein YceI
MSRSRYRIRVAGGLGPTTLGAFPEFASCSDGSSTTLTGELCDSAALYGAVARLEALGLELIDVQRHDEPHRTHQGGKRQMSTIETQALPAGTWSVDRVHSTVGFAIGYMAGTFTGTFSDFDAGVTDGVLNGSAKVASVQVKDPNLEAHLQSPDFFDAERHPELTFRSTSIERSGDELRIEGEITIKGHTEQVEITGVVSEPIADPYGGTRYGLRLETTIDRDRFGISWNMPLPNGEPALANEVVLTAELQLAKQV